ncbi:PAS-domain containing protein [Asticcacaulis sp. BYS171W]|uniref:histidine kinase n=1 Tax=Asticcacaulis aquaticus TaxID=2984212 RepID=A0ABT5HTI2_9CAUL|nr:PAS-domain containing protein [Asticcacaulis aquaticus]MDC7683373.1 PAS-domain containing protein [Asticcacaulis aquaticus]
MNGIVLLLAAAAYVGGLFAIGAWAEKHAGAGGQPRFRLPAYALALGVYCTSWTFYGAVGSAVGQGWSFAPIYLGPILVWLVAPKFLSQLIAAVQAEGATSISDFIGARFGKSRGVAALVTLLALFGTIPYLALQLRSVGTSFAQLAGGETVWPMALTAGALGLFAILFGTRHYVASSRNAGVLYVVAAESLVKLLALVAVAGFAVLAFQAAPPAARDAGWLRFSARFDPSQIDLDFVVITLVSMAAIVCLPRQFYTGVIGADRPDDATKARGPFVGYLLLTLLVIPPITLAGLTLLPSQVSHDLFVLNLPFGADVHWLTLLVFIGGFSAATGMALVETIALSTMISNDLIAPFLLRHRTMSSAADFGRLMLWVRRISIGGVMGAALTYALWVPPSRQLAFIGLIAFAAIAQFTPALLLAVRGKVRDATAIQAGLLSGLIVWFYTLFFPTLAPEPWLTAMAGGVFNPVGLFGLSGIDPLTHGVIASLGANGLAWLAVSAFGRTGALPGFRLMPVVREGRVQTLEQLTTLTARFAGAEAVSETFGPVTPGAPVDRSSARRAERLIAGVVGAPSAHAIVSSALSGTTISVEDVARLLDQSGQSLQFSKGLLAATLENIDPGVSVIDQNLRLVAWNSRYLDLFQYPPSMIRVGAPVADLIRYNAERGECGPGEVESHVARRLEHMRRGARHSFERRRADGKVLKTVGGPMPGGGYVMCFTDITNEAAALAGLEHARLELESRVVQRTAELQAANAALARATEEKTRFLAAASHDLLQPLHAARLFTAALSEEVAAGEGLALVGNVERSIDAADALLRSLLDISKLDAGGIVPRVARFNLLGLVQDIEVIFAPLAAEKGIALRLWAPSVWVETDRNLLRSILQNFVSNAVRYTERGGVLIAVRPRQDRVRIEVYDTGCGIADEDYARIFREFERLGVSGEAGIGLGLAIVERTARLLDLPVEVRSRLGKGSRFTVILPMAAVPEVVVPAQASTVTSEKARRILIVDDEPAVRDAMAALLARWGCDACIADDPDAAMAHLYGVDGALVDYNLSGGADGLSLIARLRAAQPDLRVALVTADHGLETAKSCEAAGVPLFYKPLDPKVLKNWLGI